MGTSNDLIVMPPPRDALERIKALVLDAVPSPHSRRAYDKGLSDFLDWWLRNPQAGGFTKAAVQRFRMDMEARGLSSSTINVRLTAVRRLAAEAADNGLLDPTLAAGIGRVKGKKQQGTRSGNWLTVEQAERILNYPDDSPKGLRDRAVLAVLIGCGLRRAEASALTFAHVQQRDGRWAIVDLRGKGNRVRTVPMPPWTKAAIDAWAKSAGISEGRVFRPVNKGGRISGDVLDPQSIMDVVTFYGGMAGVRIAPHDLRRTFAKLAHKGRAAIEQIQLSLGHSSIVTTERYLGVRQDLEDAPCDHLGIRPKVA